MTWRSDGLAVLLQKDSVNKVIDKVSSTAWAIQAQCLDTKSEALVLAFRPYLSSPNLRASLSFSYIVDSELLLLCSSSRGTAW